MRTHPRLAGTRALFEVHKGTGRLLAEILAGFRVLRMDTADLSAALGLPEPVIVLLLAEARRCERERAAA